MSLTAPKRNQSSWLQEGINLEVWVPYSEAKVSLLCLNNCDGYDLSSDLFPFTLDNTKSKTDKFSKISNWGKLKNKHSKVLLNSFPMNGHTLGFCTWSQNLENFVSPKVSLSESKG